MIQRSTASPAFLEKLDHFQSLNTELQKVELFEINKRLSIKLEMLQLQLDSTIITIESASKSIHDIKKENRLVKISTNTTRIDKIEKFIYSLQNHFRAKEAAEYSFSFLKNLHFTLANKDAANKLVLFNCEFFNERLEIIKQSILLCSQLISYFSENRGHQYIPSLQQFTIFFNEYLSNSYAEEIEDIDSNRKIEFAKNIVSFHKQSVELCLTLGEKQPYHDYMHNLERFFKYLEEINLLINFDQTNAIEHARSSAEFIYRSKLYELVQRIPDKSKIQAGKERFHHLITEINKHLPNEENIVLQTDHHSKRRKIENDPTKPIKRLKIKNKHQYSYIDEDYQPSRPAKKYSSTDDGISTKTILITLEVKPKPQAPLEAKIMEQTLAKPLNKQPPLQTSAQQQQNTHEPRDTSRVKFTS